MILSFLSRKKKRRNILSQNFKKRKNKYFAFGSDIAAMILEAQQLSSSREPILPVRKVKVVLIRVQKWQAGGTAPLLNNTI